MNDYNRPEKLKIINGTMYQMEERLETIERELAQLEEHERITASVHWRDGKYLVLVYPTDKDGNRKRQYIGSDPAKVKEALDAVQRQERYEQLSQEKLDLRHKINWIDHDLSNLVYKLKTYAEEPQNV